MEMTGEERKKRVKLIEEERNVLIEEVFLRLPPPSVARFKCISKWWRRFLSEPPFVERYQARNLLLLGFFHQRSHDRFVFGAITSNFPPEISTGNVPRAGIESFRASDNHNTLAVINSSNGLLLLYSSKPTPQYRVYNPITGGKVFIRYSYWFQTFAKRFMVFGFAFDPYCTNPCFTIVDIADAEARKFRVFSYSSLSPHWETTSHNLPTYVRDNCALSGPSTFYRGALHWLFEPSGVFAYNVCAKTISFSLIYIPGDENYLDDNGLCLCVKKLRDCGLYSNGCCNCRYLGESRDQLIYIRVTGHSQFSLWTLEDYCRGIWSRTGLIDVGNLPASLFLGRVLAFDRMEPRLLYLKVKNKIFSYHRINGVLEELCRITKEYGGEENCLGFIIPYELPRISVSIPRYTRPRLPPVDSSFAFLFDAVKQLHADPLAITADVLNHPKANLYLDGMKSIVRRLKDDGLFHLYNQLGISQAAARCFPHLQHVELNAAGPPVWSSYNFHAPFTFVGLRDTVIGYTDFIHVEASLYGFTTETHVMMGGPSVSKSVEEAHQSEELGGHSASKSLEEAHHTEVGS